MPIRLRALGKEFGYSFFPMISHYFSFLGAAPLLSGYLCGFLLHMNFANWCAHSFPSINFCIQDTPDYSYNWVRFVRFIVIA